MGVRPRGALPNWQPTTERQRAILADLIARYDQHERENTYPRGPRGIFYDLRPSGMGNGMTYRKKTASVRGRLEPMTAGVEQVGEVLTLARRAGLIPERLIADERSPSAHSAGPYDSSAEEEAESVVRRVVNAVRWFHLDPQEFQPVHLIIWSEAGDLVPRIAQTAHQYGVAVQSGSGFDSIKLKRATGEEAAERSTPTVILHIGDFDPHGQHIFTSFTEDIVAWAAVAGAPDGHLMTERLALTEEQAVEFDLLDADGKAEADGIPVPELDRLVREGIEAHQSAEGIERWMEREAEERERLPELIRRGLARLDLDDPDVPGEPGED